jgi:S-adenosylmethionine:tRNA ribosyltransferase-isomerase
LKTTDFDYQLPPDLIAQRPIEPRDASRLMIIDRQASRIEHRHFYDLPAYTAPGDMLVLNESRVIPARLWARKPTGGQVEILLLRQRTERTWETLVRGRNVREGLSLTLLEGKDGEPTEAHCHVVDVGRRGVRILAFEEAVLPTAQAIGSIPLPPYIHEKLADGERYQTVYARRPGSAAAPTAGLHFTPTLLHELRKQGVRFAYVTLHVGLDTFQPVTEDQIEDHVIHTEFCSLTADEAERINQATLSGQRIFAVGTTSVRVLETAAQAATSTGQCTHDGAEGTAGTAQCPLQRVSAYRGATDLYIYPGYEFRAVDSLITNFHLPRSTLLMLVSAFMGQSLLRRAYREAIERRYRFYSFGDAMLIL